MPDSSTRPLAVYPEFLPIRTCQKCGYVDNHRVAYLLTIDCLERDCSRCGYVWREACVGTKTAPAPLAVKVEITFICWRCKAALPALAAYRYYNLMLCSECCTLAARSTAH